MLFLQLSYYSLEVPHVIPLADDSSKALRTREIETSLRRDEARIEFYSW